MPYSEYGYQPSFIGGASEMGAAVKDYFSKDTVISGVGVMGGMLVGEYAGDWVADYLGWTGMARVGALGIGKLGLGVLLTYFGRNLTGSTRMLVNGFAVGTMASFLVDIYTYLQGSIGSPKARRVVSVSPVSTAKSVPAIRQSNGTVLSTNEL